MAGLRTLYGAFQPQVSVVPPNNPTQVSVCMHVCVLRNGRELMCLRTAKIILYHVDN